MCRVAPASRKAHGREGVSPVWSTAVPKTFNRLNGALVSNQTNTPGAGAKGGSGSSQVTDSPSADLPHRDTSPPPASPFTQAAVHRQVGNQEAQAQTVLTLETVDRALDEVRPFLIADGGNVKVVSVLDGVVSLEFQGACGTCPSSSATMTMGIERSLHATFGSHIRDIVQVNAQDTSATLGRVDDHLNMLRGAIQSYGGSIAVESVSDGECRLLYAGPKAIAMGIQAAVRDQFPDLKQVVILDAETGTSLSLD